MKHHHYHSPLRRGIYSFLLIFSLMFVGTVGIHLIERMSFIDSFYFMSMIVTAQGPASSPHTPLGKIFTAFMAFISVGTVVASLGFVFGPFLGKLWRVGVLKIEEELRLLNQRKKE